MMKAAKWLILILTLISCNTYAQQFMRYQGVIRNASGAPYLDQTFQLKVSIIADSASGAISWQEKHALTSSALNGRFIALIGSGTSTGLGSVPTFASIPWSLHRYYISIEIDLGSTGVFVPYGTVSLFSIPYAFYSSSSGKSDQFLNALTDVDTSNIQMGKVLKWDGVNWIISADMDRDTVSYASVSQNAVLTDTALFTLNYPLDSVQYAHYTTNAVYSNASNNASAAGHVLGSDTAAYVYVTVPDTWIETGNAIGLSSGAVGTNDAQSFQLRTNNISQMVIDSAGGISIGSSLLMGFSQSGTSLFMHTAPSTGGKVNISGAGTRFAFFPVKGVFNVGTAVGPEWDSTNLGNYSMALGENVKTGSYAFSIGKDNIATGDNAMVFGRSCSGTALGTLGNGTSFCVGDSCQATGVRTVVMGRKCHSGNTTAVSIGYQATALANVSTAIGYNVKTTTGLYSMVLGSYANSSNRQGCFVYGDRSTTSYLTPTANSQMLIRASGGIYMFSDSARTTGVVLMPGSGSWSMVSDRNKKENLVKVDYENVLSGISDLEIRTWSYKTQGRNIVHIGPTAQSFRKEFHLGESKRTIGMIDMDGVILSGIKGIYIRNTNFNQQEMDTEKLIKCTATEMEELDKRIKELEDKLNN